MGERDNKFSYKDSVTLKDYFDSRLEGAEKATELAIKIIEKRLDSMNEFKEVLKNQTSSFITRAEIDIQLEKIEGDIKILRESKANLEGKASQLYVTITLIVALLGLFISFITMLDRIKF